MKNFITIILIFTHSIVFGQNLDSLTFGYINQYRVQKGKNILIWSDTLYKTCVKHTNDMLVNDSMYHSHGYVYSENVSYSKSGGLLVSDDYKIFIKKYFNLSSEDVLKNIKVFCGTLAVYNWSISGSHNKIMLSNGKYGAVHIILKDVVKKKQCYYGS